MAEDGGVADDELAAARTRRALRQQAAQLATEELIDIAQQGQRDRLDMHGHAVVKGVTVNWLAQVFHLDHRVCAQRLKDCPPLTRKRGGHGLLYDVAIAAEYLVKPRFDAEQYIKTMKIEELPAKLQEGFWAAALKRQKWEENAGRLWRTEDVVKKFSETFLMIANTMRLWVDDLDAVMEITEPQRKALENCVRDLQQQVGKTIKSLPRVTQSQLAEMADKPTPVLPAPEEEEHDDIDADIRDVV
jgi:hypothetical protein